MTGRILKRRGVRVPFCFESIDFGLGLEKLCFRGGPAKLEADPGLSQAALGKLVGGLLSGGPFETLLESQAGQPFISLFSGQIGCFAVSVGERILEFQGYSHSLMSSLL